MPQILFPDADALASFCRRHRIWRLSLFGSMRRGAARPDSDIGHMIEAAETIQRFVAGRRGADIDTDEMRRKPSAANCGSNSCKAFVNRGA